MRRFFGGKNPEANRKKRLSPSAGAAAQGLASPTKGGGPDPGYQYALNEYAQTVAPATSNDDGQQRSIFSAAAEESTPELAAASRSTVPPDEEAPAASPHTGGESSPSEPPQPHAYESLADAAERAARAQAPPRSRALHPQSSYHERLSETTYAYRTRKSFPEASHKDASYEEMYGDAYIGGPIKYIYPSGYQSMRPRGGPWKLSIVICLLFTWLSVFIIGHCSDRVDQSLYYDQDVIDDDAIAIETRWCGSRLLYLMWVLSMLITGLASAYCSVIGYIKVRDFAVANNRSQPPGFLGKSDFYVELRDHHTHPSSAADGGGDLSHDYYQHTIYQADGTPQFWGGHIYRPTQAAVNITSR